jgi:type IV secretory pathway VirB6-like protein
MLFRNPTPAAMLVFAWEAINPVLPSLLQKISVASYLRHLMPITIPGQGIFALLMVKTDPVSGWIASFGLLLLIAAVLSYSCYRIRTLEIRYTTD